LPAVHNVDAGKLPLVEVDIEYAGDLTGVLHADACQFVKPFCGNLCGMQKHFLKAGGPCRRLRSQIGTHLFRRIEQLETVVYGKISALSILGHTERADAARFLRPALGGETFALHAFVDLCAFLCGNILAVQFIQARLHDGLRVRAAFLQHTLQRGQPAPVHPQLERNIIRHVYCPLYHTLSPVL
jgi:hypothetical protein